MAGWEWVADTPPIAAEHVPPLLADAGRLVRAGAPGRTSPPPPSSPDPATASCCAQVKAGLVQATAQVTGLRDSGADLRLDARLAEG